MVRMSRCYTCGAMHWWLGRNASRRLGVTAQGGSGRVCGQREALGSVACRGLGLCAMMRTRRHLVGDAMEVPNEMQRCHDQCCNTGN